MKHEISVCFFFSSRSERGCVYQGRQLRRPVQENVNALFIHPWASRKSEFTLSWHLTYLWSIWVTQKAWNSDCPRNDRDGFNWLANHTSVKAYHKVRTLKKTLLDGFKVASKIDYDSFSNLMFFFLSKFRACDMRKKPNTIPKDWKSISNSMLLLHDFLLFLFFFLFLFSTTMERR